MQGEQLARISITNIDSIVTDIVTFQVTTAESRANELEIEASQTEG